MLLSEKSDEVTRFKKKTKRYFLIQHAVKLWSSLPHIWQDCQKLSWFLRATKQKPVVRGQEIYQEEPSTKNFFFFFARKSLCHTLLATSQVQQRSICICRTESSICPVLVPGMNSPLLRDWRPEEISDLILWSILLRTVPTAAPHNYTLTLQSVAETSECFQFSILVSGGQTLYLCHKPSWTLHTYGNEETQQKKPKFISRSWLCLLQLADLKQNQSVFLLSWSQVFFSILCIGMLWAWYFWIWEILAC